MSNTATRGSPAYTVIKNFMWTNDDQNSVAADITGSMSDDDAAKKWLDANPDKAAQYKAGKTGLLGFFVGQVMKSAPNADAAEVNRMVRERLG